MSSANMHVTMVGVGNIGAAMVRTWLKRGTSVTMWNRNPNRPVLKELVEKGAVYEPSLGKAIAAGDVFVVCVSTYDSIKEMFSPLLPLVATAAPKRIVNLSTGTSQQARDMATLLKSNGVPVYLDGAIMVTPDLIQWGLCRKQVRRTIENLEGTRKQFKMKSRSEEYHSRPIFLPCKLGLSNAKAKKSVFSV